MTTQDQYLPPKAITEPRRKRKYEQNKNIRHETTIFTWFTLFLCFHDEFLKAFKVQYASRTENSHGKDSKLWIF